MTSMEEQGRCFYLDSEYQPASDMLRKCVNDNTSPYRFNCGDNPMRQEMPEDIKETARMNDIAIQRGFSYYNVDNYNMNSFLDNKSVVPVVQKPVQQKPAKQKPIVQKPIKKGNNLEKFNYEGFQNQGMFITDNGLGESSIPRGECPEGYTRCPISGKCIQTCISCVYRDNMKSREFNEADPCFPNGVYNGIDNNGDIKCTCGRDNKYCSDDFTKKMFTTDGMMIFGQKIIMNTGITGKVDELFNFDYL
jgi:hypothetical protein